MPNAENASFYIRHPASFMQGAFFINLLGAIERGFARGLATECGPRAECDWQHHREADGGAESGQAISAVWFVE